MAEPPKPTWLTQEQAAESCGVSVRTFRAWQVEPVGQIGTCRYYDGRAILENRLAARKRRRRPKATPAELKARVDALETELMNERAEAQRLRNANRRGELVTTYALRQAIAQACTRSVAILDPLPGKIKRAAPALTNTEVHMIRRAIARRQNQAAELTLHDLGHWSRDDG